MEDLQPLTIVCRHIRGEARDATIFRLRKQKSAAHAQNYRIRRKMRKLELTNRLLTSVYMVCEQHNSTLRKLIEEFVDDDNDEMQPVRVVAQGDPA